MFQIMWDILPHCCRVDIRGGATGCLHKRGRVGFSLSLEYESVFVCLLSSSWQLLHIARRGDKVEWFSPLEGRRARYSSLVGGEGGYG